MTETKQVKRVAELATMAPLKPMRANGGHLTHFVPGESERSACGHEPKSTTRMARGYWVPDPLDQDRTGVALLSTPSLCIDLCKRCLARLGAGRQLPDDRRTWALLLTVPSFGPEPGPGDTDTLSDIVDHCQHREHAVSVAWIMAGHRPDREALAEAAGQRWDWLAEIAAEQYLP